MASYLVNRTESLYVFGYSENRLFFYTFHQLTCLHMLSYTLIYSFVLSREVYGSLINSVRASLCYCFHYQKSAQREL